MGVEPTSLAWKASIINRYTTAALKYSCNIFEKYCLWTRTITSGFADPRSNLLSYKSKVSGGLRSNSSIQQGILGGGILYHYQNPSNFSL